MRQIQVILVIAAICISACKKEELKPAAPPAPPEPSPEQIYAEIRPILQPIAGAANTLGTPMPDNAWQKALEDLRTAKAKHQAKENGRIGLSRTKTDIVAMVSSARDLEKWRVVLAGIQLYEILDPGGERFRSLKPRAEEMVNRPKVVVDGFFEIDGELYAFLKVTDRKTKEESTYRVREGEEFHETLRLIQIIGDRQAVEILYIPANYAWEIPGPRDRN